VFNPLDPAFIRDPYPFYRRLREQEPLHRSPLGFVVATRHADIAFLLRDRTLGKRFRERMIRRLGPEALNETAYRGLELMMLTRDPPDHTRLRGLVTKAFTARRVEEMRPRIQALVDGLLDKLADRGEMDVIRDFAHPLPVMVICDMLGIPEQERAPFLESSRIVGRILDPVPVSRAELDRANASSNQLSAYFNDLFERRRRNPRDDLITHLVQAEEAGDRLSNDELFANVQLLFGAGHETTTNTIGNGLLALHRHPDQLALLKADPSLMPNAVEEVLRYDSAVQMTGRASFGPVEIGGFRIEDGEGVICLLGAGNRDPAAHQDPDRLDVRRKDPKPLSFGGGIHHCLGAQLSRIETDIVFRTLFRRLPKMELTEKESPEWRPTFTLRGLTKLPAAWRN
jgi:cytochrome P450